ncbi:MAG: RNA polymerase factor sigma-54 [Acidobacteriota bacterium]
MLHLSQQLKLLQKLTPQQIQYLKLLQLPTLSLEQRIKTELEVNPMLEEGAEDELELQQDDSAPEEGESATADDEAASKKEDEFTFEDFLNDDVNYTPKAESTNHDEDREDFPIAASEPLAQKLREQLQLGELTEKGMLVANEIIGNIDEDGYLHRNLDDIVNDINLTHHMHITLEQAEEVLHIIQRLEPIGIGSRTLQECLLVQLEMLECDPTLRARAMTMLRDYYDAFTKKHFEAVAKNMGITLDEVKQILTCVSRLNPKPGEGTISMQENYLTPDFIVTKDDGDFIIQLNDKNVPPLRINRNYRNLISKRKNGVTADTKQFLRQKFEAAKWFIASIHQRRDTMLKVMRTIVERQREFFERGEGLKPLIYKNIAEAIQMDISTISRVVNGKYVQTDYGVFELRHFFSEGISLASGEEVANKEVKERIREIICGENPHKPLSDDHIAEMLNEQGYNIARRTVAKYRESMMIPVARLRRKI